MKRPSQVTIAAIALLIAVGVVLIRALPRGNGDDREGGVTHEVRRPAVAGLFYPADTGELQAAVEGYLAAAESPPASGEPIGVIAPHAGYVYSGQAAGYAYRAVKGRHYDTVVVIGPSHRARFSGAALSGAREWATPLGRIAVDADAVRELAERCPAALVYDAPHEQEHSVEVELPFLQVALGEFKLLPVVMGDDSRETCAALAEALAEWARGRRVLFVASTDMSHYPKYEDAKRVDTETLEAIATLDSDRVAETCDRLISEGLPGLGTCLCGESAVKTVLMAAKRLDAEEARVLHYANSGDSPEGGRDRVVGYGAVAIYRASPHGAADRGQEVSEADRARLLAVARQAVEAYVCERRLIQVAAESDALARPGAAFVTLKKDGMLRGCIGSLTADRPLIETVRDTAAQAACRDPRLPPVQEGELD